MEEPRPFVDEDMPRLMAVVAEWIAEAGHAPYDHVGELPHRVYENLHGRGPVGELVKVWEDAAGVAGIAVCLRFGQAFDVFCAPRHRGGDAEKAMLAYAADMTSRRMAAGEPYVLTDLFATDEVRARLLRELGFACFRVWDEVLTRSLVDVPDAVVAAGFTVRSAGPGDADGLAEVRNASFGSAWTGAGYRDGVMLRPGFDAGDEVVAVSPDGRVAAFAVAWADERNGLGHFEPVGTHRDFRRLGLARAVMAEAMRRMAVRGLRRVTVNHDAENVGAGRLYAGLGFVRECRTHGYRRAR